MLTLRIMALTKRERKAKLREVGGRGIQNRIAEEVGKSPSTVSLVMNGKTQLLDKQTVREVRAAIAQKIGETVEEVWGSAA